MKIYSLIPITLLISIACIAHVYSMEEEPIAQEIEQKSEPAEIQKLLNILGTTVSRDLKFYAALPIIKQYSTGEINNLHIPEEVKEYVLNLKAEISKALHKQVTTGNVEAVQLLLNFGADPNHITDGVLLLISAMIPFSKNNKEITRLLIEKGADVNAQYGSGTTALIIAAINGWHEIIQLLLEAGANPKHTDAYGKTALDLAEIYHREKAAHVLKQAMALE
jgi:ankyrin repeat protein